MTAVMVSVVPDVPNIAAQAVALARELDADGHGVLGFTEPTPYLKAHETMGLYLFAVRLASREAATHVRAKIRRVWPKAEIETAIAKTCGARQQMHKLEQASQAHAAQYTPVMFDCVLDEGHAGRHVTERPEGRVEFDVRVGRVAT